MPEKCEDGVGWGDRSVSSSAGLWGTLVGTFQAGFTVTMKTAAGAGTHTVPSIEKENEGFSCNLKSAHCTPLSTEKYADNSIFLFIATQKKADVDLPATVDNLR